jgi:histidinol-phosphate aminotransferase
MTSIENLEINPNLPLSERFSKIKPYGAPQLDCQIKLNTNENPYPLPQNVRGQILEALEESLDTLNRYPDRLHVELRLAIAAYLKEVTGQNLSSNQIWAANGSNEILQQILQAFNDVDQVALGFEPSYSMHKILSGINGYRYISSDRDVDFSINLEKAKDLIKLHLPRIIFITTPNNPTGTSIASKTIEELLNFAPQSIFIIDEAYGEFSQANSAINLIEKYPNLFITRTMSKAFAFAGARIGYAVAQENTLAALALTRLPYHLSTQSQVLAKVALENHQVLQQQVSQIIATRDWMQNELAKIGLSVIESDANFFLFGHFADEKAVWQLLVEHSVLVRDVSIKGFLRVTVGTEAESTTFVETLRGLMNNKQIELI